MKNHVFLIVVLSLFILVSCQNDKTAKQEGNSIAELEKSVDAFFDKDKAQELIGLYQQHIDAHPEDKVTNDSYHYRAAALYFRQNQYPAAANTLLDLLRTSKGSKVEASALHLLGDLYKDHLNYPALAQDLYLHVTKAFPNYEEMTTIKNNLNANGKPLSERITETANSIYDEKNGLPNARMARKYIAACEVNALTHPDDPQAAELLLKAAMTARTTARNPEKALKIYDWVYKGFPKYEKSYQALFLKAFTLDNDMKKFDEAKAQYEAFLQKYPEDEFAVSTKFLLDNLGKSDDEIIKQFEKKKGE